jgi:hypothetical protein
LFQAEPGLCNSNVLTIAYVEILQLPFSGSFRMTSKKNQIKSSLIDVSS